MPSLISDAFSASAIGTSLLTLRRSTTASPSAGTEAYRVFKNGGTVIEPGLGPAGLQTTGDCGKSLFRHDWTTSNVHAARAAALATAARTIQRRVQPAGGAASDTAAAAELCFSASATAARTTRSAKSGL